MHKHSLKIAALALALVGSSSAFAQSESSGGKTSEFQHQAEAGRFELTPQLNYSMATTKFKQGTLTKMESTVFGEAVMLEYGINEMFSVGGTLGHASAKTKYTPSTVSADTKANGLMDPSVFFNGRHDVGPGVLRYFADLSFSLEKAKTKANGDENMASGGTTLTGGVGYELPAGPGVVGGRLSYELIQTDRTEESTATTGVVTTSKTEGGNTLAASAFYELDLAPWTLGFDFTYESHAKTKSETAGVKTDDNNQYNAFIFGVYAPYAITEDITLLPRFQYGSYNHGNAETRQYVKSSEGWAMLVGARFAF